jgi:3' terminal RNA ribose 2'-O-methyltransferase Hen1
MAQIPFPSVNDAAHLNARFARPSMLLTITTTHAPATELGYLLHKHPARVQSFELSFGQAHVFYPEADSDRCTVALLLDVNPLQIARNRGTSATEGFGLHPYINDRPYVASSFMSVAIAEVFGTALSGHCKERPELADTPLPLQAKIAVLPCRGGEPLLRRLFEPLGTVSTRNSTLWMSTFRSGEVATTSPSH